MADNVVPFEKPTSADSETSEIRLCLNLIDTIQNSLPDNAESVAENEALEVGTYGEMTVEELRAEFERLSSSEEHVRELLALGAAAQTKLDELYAAP